jgi:hypothetical protein
MPHQQAAWNWLQEQIPSDVLAEFAEIYGAGPRYPRLPLQQEPSPLNRKAG